MNKSIINTCYFFSCILFIMTVSCSREKTHELSSPDDKISCKMWLSETGPEKGMLFYSINAHGKEVILPSKFQLSTNKEVYSKEFSIIKAERRSVQQNWNNKLGELSDVPDHYNELKLYLTKENNHLNFICRVYNEGVAFAYEIPGSRTRDSVTIMDEYFSFRFKDDYSSWATYRAQDKYSKVPLSQIKDGCERPLVVENDTNLMVALAEARLVDFARMKYGPDSAANHAVRTVLHGPAIRETPFQSPWRVVMIAESAGRLLEQNYLIQNLNPPSEISDPSWIKPGKVIRDITLTTTGGMACIDFAAGHGMQYVEFDAGWYGPETDETSDATTVTLDEKRSKGPFDLHRLIQYGKEKGIGVILYVNRRALEQQLDTLLPLYKSWGVDGIKYGFVQVGDQEYTRWLHEAVKKTAQYKMVVDIHDEYRPTGFSRTYPNLLTQEGIRGDEESIPNSHTLTTMFTRMLAGAGDNTVCYYADRVTEKMGSHGSQLAKAVCLFSPLQFLFWYDKPDVPLQENTGWEGTTNIIGNEPELEFFTNVPVVWDETRVITGEIGKYGVIARRNGSQWFIGGINGDVATDFKFSFDFLDQNKKYEAKTYFDNPEVDTRTKIAIELREVNNKSNFQKQLIANFGFAIHLYPVE